MPFVDVPEKVLRMVAAERWVVRLLQYTAVRLVYMGIN